MYAHWFLAFMLPNASLWAKAPSPNLFDAFNAHDPFSLLLSLIILALIPFLAILTTSFAKIVVVLSITRQALGTPQAPPNMVITSLALILTCFSMYPVFAPIIADLTKDNLQTSTTFDAAKSFFTKAEAPLKKFLLNHANPKDRAMFKDVLIKNNDHVGVNDDDWIILVPAFLISELTTAFQIGFLIYLPFVVIDLTIANLLMALGMQMLAPTTVSLPFKILLFVLIDGWRLLAEGLVKI